MTFSYFVINSTLNSPTAFFGGPLQPNCVVETVLGRRCLNDNITMDSKYFVVVKEETANIKDGH